MSFKPYFPWVGASHGSYCPVCALPFGFLFFEVIRLIPPYPLTTENNTINCVQTSLLLVFFTGNYDKTAKIKISPWPFIPTGAIVNLTVIFTPGKLMSVEYEYVLSNNFVRAVVVFQTCHTVQRYPFIQ